MSFLFPSHSAKVPVEINEIIGGNVITAGSLRWLMYYCTEKTHGSPSAWDFIEMDKNSCSLSALLLSHCSGVYSYWIEALLSAEALPVIGCLWQGSQLFRETGKEERGLSATSGSWDWLVLYQVVKFRAQMSPQRHGCLFDRPSQRKMSGPE